LLFFCAESKLLLLDSHLFLPVVEEEVVVVVMIPEVALADLLIQG